MTNYSNLSNKELYIKYQEAKANFRNSIEGSQEEKEADRIFTELSKEVETRNLDLKKYKEESNNNNNIRTMEYLGEDDWGNYVYKCIETETLYKGEIFGDEEIPRQLYSCGNEFDGEMCYPIQSDLEIHYKPIEKQPTKEQKFNYMMLGRLKSDCEYYLGYGNRSARQLYYKDVQEHINEMKKLYNSFADENKPEWLTYEQIFQYEKLMVK